MSRLPLKHSEGSTMRSSSNVQMMTAHSGSNGNDRPSGSSRSASTASEGEQGCGEGVVNSSNFEQQVRLLGHPRQSVAAENVCYWAVVTYLQSFVEDHECGDQEMQEMQKEEEREDDSEQDGDSQSEGGTSLRIKEPTDSVTSSTSCIMNVVVIEANARNEEALEKYISWIEQSETVDGKQLAGKSQYMVLLNQSLNRKDAWPAQGVEARVRNEVFRHFAVSREGLDFKREQLWNGDRGSVDHVPLVSDSFMDDPIFTNLAWEQLDHLSLHVSIWFPPTYLHPLDVQVDHASQDEEEQKASAQNIFEHFEALFRDTPWETPMDQAATSGIIRTRSTSKTNSAAATVSRVVEAYIKKTEQKPSWGLPVFPDGYPSFRLSTQITGRPASRDLPAAAELRYWGIYSGGSNGGQVILVEAKQENKSVFKEYAEFLAEYPREDNDWDAWVLHDVDNDEDCWCAEKSENVARQEGLKLYLQNRQYDYPFEQMLDSNWRKERKNGKKLPVATDTSRAANSWTDELLKEGIEAGNIGALPLERMSIHVHLEIVYCHGYLKPLRATTIDGEMQMLDDSDLFDGFYDIISDFGSRMQRHPIHTRST
eukprot:ANDGO_04711.mRNA.1 hypothetical protein